jgi:hypothetical protein
LAKEVLFSYGEIQDSWQTTPHSTTGVPPAQALFGKNIRTKLPEYSTKVKKEVDIHKRIPNIENILSNFGIIAFA